jgi:hypothetical protein
MESGFQFACRALGIRPIGYFSTSGSSGFGGIVSEELVDSRFLDVPIVHLLQGDNLQGQPIWSYTQLSGVQVARLYKAMRQKENFKPSEFGLLLTSGAGSPPRWIRDVMDREYEMVDMEVPKKASGK